MRWMQRLRSPPERPFCAPPGRRPTTAAWRRRTPSAAGCSHGMFASAEAHYLRGVVRQAQGMLSEAQRSLEKALYLDPRHYQALVHMMLLAERRGDQLGGGELPPAGPASRAAGGRMMRSEANDSPRCQPGRRCVLEPHRRAGRPVVPEAAGGRPLPQLPRLCGRRTTAFRARGTARVPGRVDAAARRARSDWRRMKRDLLPRVPCRCRMAGSRCSLGHRSGGAPPDPPRPAPHGPAAVGSGQYPRRAAPVYLACASCWASTRPKENRRPRPLRPPGPISDFWWPSRDRTAGCSRSMKWRGSTASP